MTTNDNVGFYYSQNNAPTVQNIPDGSIAIVPAQTYVEAWLNAAGTLLPFRDSTKIAKSLLLNRGDMIYATGSGDPARLPIGTSGKVLTAADGIPVWADVQMGTWAGYSDLTFYSTYGLNFNDGAYVNYSGGGLSLSVPNGDIYLEASGTVYGYGDIDTTGSVTASSFINTSDVRLKDHIEDFRLSLEAMASIPLAAFSFKADNSHTRHIGTYAQDVVCVLPEVVHENKDGIFGLDYPLLATAVSLSLVQEVKDLKEEITSLKKQLAKLKNNG